MYDTVSYNIYCIRFLHYYIEAKDITWVDFLNFIGLATQQNLGGRVVLV
jgi:hypothetical protein